MRTIGRRVLVVEDDEKSRRLLCDVLGYHGYEVTGVETGEEALAVARTRRPDAALLDIQLPGISGFEVLWKLRGGEGAPHLPVLAVTASVMDQDRRKILAAGFDAYVSKPVNIRELLETLKDLFSKVHS
jgi:two-component system cell cycle response regulator DivK